MTAARPRARVLATAEPTHARAITASAAGMTMTPIRYALVGLLAAVLIFISAPRLRAQEDMGDSPDSSYQNGAQGDDPSGDAADDGDEENSGGSVTVPSTDGGDVQDGESATSAPGTAAPAEDGSQPDANPDAQDATP
jgi:hypothetical protein